MKKTFWLSFSTTLMLVLVLGATPLTYAARNAMNLVSETNSSYTTRTGTAWQSRAEGFNGSSTYNSYQSFNKYQSGDASVGMTWYCKEVYSTNYYWHLYIAIPNNAGYPDGIYSYGAYNKKVGNTTDSFTIPVNQENFSDQWAYLGWTQGKGGNTKTSGCFVVTTNTNSAGTRQEFWVDAMKYYPSSSTTPPVYWHSFTQWIP